MTELLDLCYDVLMRILEEVGPEDLAACARTSWGFNTFIKDNKRLFKAHYLRNFDDPRSSPSDPDPDWISELQKLVKCQQILRSENMDVKRNHFKFVATTVERLICSASSNECDSLSKIQLTKLFANSRNLNAFMYRSSLYQRAGTQLQQAADDEEDQQLSAKLHCLYGVPLGPLGRRSLSTHPYARSRVYDLRNYTDNTCWGPFREDGSMKVDWEMLEALMIDLGYNSGTCCQRLVHRFKPVWCTPFGGISKNPLADFYPPGTPMEPDIPLELRDPYNISGIWLRIVCFLDYTDLYAYNFGSDQVLSDQPREPINTDEAIRHIIMRFKVTKVEPPGRFDNQDLPVVHFTGTSRSVDASWDPNANSRIRGTVRLTPESEVRWTTISVFYGGEERWRSEGIQVGGPNSKRGVIGTWFDKDYNPHGPAGPTSFWKVGDQRVSVDSDEESSDEESGHVL
ncbi:uncharacterized protein BDR25DRAFT_259061 [Lindgomyces ingoldianus]|uniref:Uncharacterized protein n=1 Tax=Lindgomyces ingoldianus TaxID=673940 RepID=A0ACB6R192_9PLEO|nr:uncharacterized protein BDR25DRAFT_259061 [Lindgomyces ingoldianus]KAF2472598.1 hypothetical protein BDR25DRAFT_259061 [Lindgomyces ingoldianus]